MALCRLAALALAIGLRGVAAKDRRASAESCPAQQTATHDQSSLLQAFVEQKKLLQTSSTGLYGKLNLANWMTDIYEVIKDRQLNQIWIPGVHDAATWDLNDKLPSNTECQSWYKFVDDLPLVLNPLKGVLPDVIQRWARTQTKTFSWMLDNGIRYFDLRPYSKDGKNFFFQHCVLSNYQVKDYLKKHFSPFLMKPNTKEIVILELNSFRSPDLGGWPDDWHRAFMQQIRESLPEGSLVDTSQDISPSSFVSRILASGPRSGSKVIISYDTGKFHRPGLMPHFSGPIRANPKETNATQLGDRQWPDTRNVNDLIAFSNEQIAKASNDRDEMMVIEGQLTPDTGVLLDWLTRASKRANFQAKTWSYCLKWEDEQGGPVIAKGLENIDQTWKATLGSKGFTYLMDNPHETDARYLISLNGNNPDVPADTSRPDKFSYGQCSASFEWWSASCKDERNTCASGYTPNSFWNGNCECYCRDSDSDYGCGELYGSICG